MCGRAEQIRRVTAKNARQQRHECKGRRGCEAWPVGCAEGGNVFVACISLAHVLSPAVKCLGHEGSGDETPDPRIRANERSPSASRRSPTRTRAGRSSRRAGGEEQRRDANKARRLSRSRTSSRDLPSRCCANDTHDLAQPLPYSSWRRHQTPVSLRPLGARSSHWYLSLIHI